MKKYRQKILKILASTTVMLLMIGSLSMATLSTEKQTNEIGEKNTLDTAPLSTHTVLVEVATAQWCGPCASWNTNIYNEYTSGTYDFEYVEVIYSDHNGNSLNPDAYAWTSIYGGFQYVPTSFFDGNYAQIVGNDPSILPSTLSTCENRAVADITASLFVTWLGNGQMSFNLNIQNNGGSQYNGHIRAFITELVSRYDTASGTDYHHGFLGFAFNKDISISAYGTYTDSATWNGNDHTDSYGNDYGDITMDNIEVLLGVYSSSTGYLDETVAATPQTNPQLSYTPTTYNFGNKIAGMTYATSFEIWDSGAPTLTYTLSESASWVTVTPTSGTSTGEHDTINVNIDTTGLSLGLHECDISISSNGGSGIFHISVNIIEPIPVLAYSPTSYDFGNVLFGNTESTTFEIWNGGIDTLTYSLSEDCSWLTLTPTSGDSTGEHDTITVSINTGLLSLGPHQCIIGITSNSGSGTFTIDVNVYLAEQTDQQQTQYNNNFALYTTRWGGQSFIPSYDVLTRVELYMRKAGSPANAVLSIRSSLTGTDLFTVSKPASQIPTTNGWVEFDFNDVTVTPGNTYYLVLRTTGGSSSNCYYWGYGSTTLYTNGVLYYSSTSGSSWTTYATYDFCFISYGKPSAPPIPLLSYSPSSYDFGTILQGDTGSTSFEIWNGGAGTLTYSLSESASWVTITPTSGTSTGEHDTITVNIDTTGLSPGSYNCPISISSNADSGTFTVYLTVIVPTPLLGYAPTSHDFGDKLVGQTGSTTFQIWNSGTGTLTYSLSESCDWVTVSPTSGGSSGEHDTITVNIDTTGLIIGSYDCDIAITSNGGSGTFTASVNVVPPAPILSYTPLSHNFGDMIAGETDSTSFQIWNSGTGTLTYSLSESSDWVTITPLSGGSTGEYDTITVNVDTTGLTPGSYSCPISISSDGGSGTFTVSLNIVTVVPALSYNPTSYNFGSMLAGYTASTNFQIWNSGTGGTLTYSLSESALWVTVSPTSGSSTGEYDTITVSIDTTGLSIGTYTCPISISSNGGSGTFTVSVTVIEQTEALDQQQTQYNNNFALYTTRWGGQSFKPTASTLTRVELYMRKTGSPPADVVLSIRSSISGPDLVSLSKSASQIPTTNSWVEFDFTDLAVIPGSTYYLVLRTASGTSTNCYYWGYGTGSPYANGVLYYSATGGSSWTSYATNDFCFKTYGISAPPIPVLSYTPTSFNFGNVAQGGTGSTTFEIWNSGTGTLSYSLSESSDWVTVTPISGSSTSEHDTITINVDTTGLSIGSYTCPITISSNGGSGLFTVYLTVIASVPSLSYAPVSYDFGDMAIDQTSSTSFEIWNGGTGALTYSLSETTSWITITPTSGSSTGEHDTITVNIDTTGMSLGSYTCPVSISSNGGSETFTVSVDIVNVAPALSYTPTSYTFASMTPGHTASTTFQIWNSGTGGILTYTLTESATWVTISPTSGSSTGEHDTITVTIDTTGMTPGSYSCPVSISSNTGSGTFTIYLTVIAATETLDQQQTQYTTSFALYTTRWGGQSFIPTVSTLTRVELYMRKTGSPPTDVVLSIRSSISGADLVSVSKPASAISTTNGWVEFDFADLTVTPGNTYYLVLKTTSGTSTNCYYWGYATGSPYANGVLYYSATGGSSWTPYASYDFCFKTYGLS